MLALAGINVQTPSTTKIVKSNQCRFIHSPPSATRWTTGRSDVYYAIQQRSLLSILSRSNRQGHKQFCTFNEVTKDKKSHTGRPTQSKMGPPPILRPFLLVTKAPLLRNYTKLCAADSFNIHKDRKSSQVVFFHANQFQKNGSSNV